MPVGLLGEQRSTGEEGATVDEENGETTVLKADDGANG
jgi:hypothetical protein